VHFVGDSITASGWYSETGGFVDQINAQIAAFPSRRYYSRVSGSGVGNGGGTSSAIVMPVAASPIVVTASGVSGNTVADIATNVAARITNYNADINVILVGINDAILGTPYATFEASYTSMLSQVVAALPTRQIACCSVLCYGEQWQAGPDPWGPNLNDVQCANIDAKIALCTAAVGATYIDFRTTLGVWETQNNPGPPGAASGVFTSDGVHPLASGEVLMGTWSMAYATVSQ
jgi:lysophospholipase L1-like esterase